MKQLLMGILLLSGIAHAQEPTSLQPLSLFDVEFAFYTKSVLQQLSYPSNDAVAVYCFPAGRNEWMISIQPGKDSGCASYAETDLPIWHSFEIRTNVTVRRMEKYISADTARRVSERWQYSVRNLRVQDDSRHIRDGERYWFIIDGDTVAQCSNPSDSTEPGQLVQIANQLRNIITNTDENSQEVIKSLEDSVINEHPNHGLESTSAPPAARTLETHP